MPQRLKLLIVDDEKYIRNFLKLIIDWDSIGIDICGEASCAAEGLLLVDELQPNIIISDICMDLMNGIEFSKIVKSRYAYTKIILLSGHSEFKYAKQGIEIGVSAYLLKPIDEEKIKETLLTVKRTILQEKEKEDEIQEIKNYLNQNKDYLTDNYLNALLMPNADINTMIRQLSYLDIDFQPSYFQVVAVSLNHESLTDDSPDTFLSSLKCNQILHELLNSIPNVYIFHDLGHNNIILSNNVQLNILSKLEDIKVTVLERLPCYLTIGVGQPCTTIRQLRNSYLSALEATRYRTVLGNNQIIQYNYIGLQYTPTAFNLEDEISGMIMSVKSCDYEDASRIIDLCINQHISIDATDITPVRVTVSTIINHLTNLLIQNNLRSSDSFSYCLQSHERLFRLEIIEELRNLTLNLIRSIIEAFTELRSDQNNSVIDSVLDYLEINYQDSQLTLSSTAKKFFINPSYLSRLFSQKNEMTFSKYLIELRLKKAAELLLSSTCKSYEIAGIVGFNDAKYFSASFKKHYGMTTSEYRVFHAEKH